MKGLVTSRLFRSGTCYLWMISITAILAGCALIYPKQYEYITRLTPVSDVGTNGRYAIRDDGTVSYSLEGVRIDVRYMTDQELNQRFPAQSSMGEFSVNPYTYGNYVDPDAGYVRNRFTVFEVTVYNQSMARVELQPLNTLLFTDRPGEVLYPYSIQASSSAEAVYSPRNFEAYYRRLRGPSGNEDYRFNMRMGLVRTHNYAIEESIFRGESYGGFIVFDPLDPEVQSVRLLIRDFILRFNAFGRPLDTTDIEFHFDRSLSYELIGREREILAFEFDTEAVLSGASEVSGAVTGDITRESTTIDAFINERLDDLNRCFEREFLAGRASEGEVVVEFTILPNGMVDTVEVVRSGVVSDAVDECIAQRISSWRFEPSSRLTPGEEDPAAPMDVPSDTATPRVTVRSVLEFIDIRQE